VGVVFAAMAFPRGGALARPRIAFRDGTPGG